MAVALANLAAPYHQMVPPVNALAIVWYERQIVHNEPSRQRDLRS